MQSLARHLALLALALFAAAPGSSRAALIVSAETVTTAPGSTGFVQVLLKNDNASDQTIAGFSVDLVLSGASVRFTGVDDQTTLAYIFGTEGTGTLTFDAFTNTGFILSDDSLNADGFVTVAAGTTVGLGRIAFEVDAAAANGLRPITFTVGATTQFTDADNEVITDVSLVGGGIDVRGAVTPVPEPASAMLLLVGSGCGLFAAWRRKRLAGSATA